MQKGGDRVHILSNLLWMLLGGFWLALLWGVVGALLCITVVGIPFGIQCFKLARLSLFPYGKKVDLNVGEHPIANVIWAVLIGWELALIHMFFGILNCITVIGIPRGIQCLKIMKLALCPFGAKVR